MARIRLGERLVKEGTITQEQLEMALREQARTGSLLGEVLNTLGFVTQENIMRILAADAGMEFVSLRGATISEDLTKLLPEPFARKHKAIPVNLSNGTLKVAMSNIFDVEAIDELQELTGYFVQVVATTEEDMAQALNGYYGTKVSVDGISSGGKLETEIEETVQRLEKEVDVVDEAELGTAPPMVRLLDLLIAYAIQSEATDLHIEPEENLVRTRYRIDGVLCQGATIPKKFQSAVTIRVKITSGMNISEARIPQDGKIKTTVNGKAIDIRVNSFPTTFGETIAMRLLDKEKLVRGLESLGFFASNLEIFKKMINKPHGIILVTGPTGSGKTTTLYSTLTFLNSLERKIITVEDPVEYELPLIRQSQINPKAGLTFAAGLRAILRQDPDVIFVGETRDGETAEMAVRSALTGHLVFSTLHTNDSVGAIPRLIDMGVEPFLVSSSLVGVVAQRLVRILCKQCKEETTPDPVRLKDMNWEGQLTKCYKSKGCPSCRSTGYRGRIALIELLAITPELSELIVKRADDLTMKAMAISQGMKTLKEDGLEKIRQGITSLEEVQKVAGI
ncbi:MAG TPA: GspE/PulE family protein [Candidatus Tripitaka californicus]|uniref:GspE/PulE family protein n=1 Tax=Candidatus Tripitaka californicus TaxID=3367616 RepID=UPI0040261911|nr:type II/IV secretion system protein [Planctomycetota bacterium]